jgi:hypothetical protein
LTTEVDPKVQSEHEAMFQIAVEELETKAAPAELGVKLNHNETLVVDLED